MTNSVMRGGSFETDRGRGRGSIDEAEPRQLRIRPSRQLRQSENHVNVLNLIHEATHTHTMKCCLKGLKHIYTKDERTKVMNNDIVT